MSEAMQRKWQDLLRTWQVAPAPVHQTFEAAGLILGLCFLATGVGLTFGYWNSASDSPPQEPAQSQKQPEAKSSNSHVDSFGDPLPPGALARMGTVRLQQPYPRMAFSADGKSLTSVGADNTVRTWDIATGKYLRGTQLEETADLDTSAISLAPDGKALLVWRAGRLWMAVYDVDTGKKLGIPLVVKDQPYRAAVSPGGKMVAASTLARKAQILLHLWDVATGAERILLEDTRHHEELEFSPDGKYLADVSGTYGLRVWDTATAKLLYHLNVETGCFTFSPDSKTIASANYDRTVKMWEVGTGKEQATLQTNPKHDTQRLAFSPDGKLLAAAGQRGIRLWDVAAGKVVQQLPERMVYELAFAPDSKLLAAGGGSSIRLWEPATGKQLLIRDGHKGEVESITPSPNGKILASTSYSEGTFCLWDSVTGKLLHQPTGVEIAGRDAGFSADGKLVATGGHDGFVHLWVAATGKEARRFPLQASGPEEPAPFVDAVRLSPDGKRLAAVVRLDERRPSQIIVWDATIGKLLSQRPGVPA
jgi:WD40 repeat protein